MGYASDKIGRRKVLLASLLGSAGSFLLAGFANSITFLIISRAVAGFTGGSIPVAMAYVSDVVPMQDRPKFFGITGACIGIAFTIGPAVGALVSALSGPATAFFVASGFSFLSFLYALRGLKDPVRVQSSEPEGDVEGPVETRWYPLACVAACMFLIEFAWSASSSMYPLLIMKEFGYGSVALGLILMSSGVVLIIVQGGIIRRIVPVYGKHAIGALGASLLAAGGIGFGLYTEEVAPHLALFALHVIGFSFASTAFPSLVSRYAAADEQGASLGIGQTARSLARVISPMLAGELYTVSLDMSGGFLSGGALPFLIGGACAILAAIMAGILGKCHAADEQKESGGVTLHMGEQGVEGEEEQASWELIFLMHHVAQQAGCPHYKKGIKKQPESLSSDAEAFWALLMKDGEHIAKSSSLSIRTLTLTPILVVNVTYEANPDADADPCIK